MSQRKRAEIPAARMKVNILLTLVKRPPLNKPQRFSMSSCSQLSDTMAGRPVVAGGAGRPTGARLNKRRPPLGAGFDLGEAGAGSIKLDSFRAHLNHLDAVAVATHRDCFDHGPQPGGDDAEAHEISGHAQEQLEQARQPLARIKIVRARITGQHR